jgi:formamidopyrimidine-DNA glycosylase
MPELPEVQATVDYLRERVEGCSIIRASVSWGRTVSPLDPSLFETRVAGTTVTSVFRRGKYIGMELHARTQAFLFTHLRMSGSLDVVPTNFPIAKHDRVCLELNSGKSIRFNDARKFGRMALCADPETVVGHLGPEPLDQAFTATALERLLLQRTGKIKPVLLDQSVLAGLGNIYVDEALWKVRVHPQTPANKLDQKTIIELHAAIQGTLHEAIEKLGTDFGDGVVDGGMYKPRVYGREGKRCLRCGEMITRLVVAQRGTHICRFCQKKPRLRKKRLLQKGRKK